MADRETLIGHAHGQPDEKQDHGGPIGDPHKIAMPGDLRAEELVMLEDLPLIDKTKERLARARAAKQQHMRGEVVVPAPLASESPDINSSANLPPAPEAAPISGEPPVTAADKGSTGRVRRRRCRVTFARHLVEPSSTTPSDEAPTSNEALANAPSSDDALTTFDAPTTNDAEGGPAGVELNVLLKASTDPGVQWDWSDNKLMLATIDRSNVLCIFNYKAVCKHREELPGEGKTILLSWEPSGKALAVVQTSMVHICDIAAGTTDHWNGMTVTKSLPVLSKSLSVMLQRSKHFDISFACWSTEAGKLMLGLSDGSCACYDHASKSYSMTRKHVAGKLKQGVTCAAWGARGEVLAVGAPNFVTKWRSSDQLKVSKPMPSAAWEETEAKLFSPKQTPHFKQLAFAPDDPDDPDGELLLAALEGKFEHAGPVLCVYRLVRSGGLHGTQLVAVGEKSVYHLARSGGLQRTQLVAVGENISSATVHGAILAFFWLNSDVLAVVTRTGYCWLLECSDEGLIKEQHVASPHAASMAAGGVVAAVVVKSRGLIACVTRSGLVSFFSPTSSTLVSHDTIKRQLPPAPGDRVHGTRYPEPKSLQAAKNFLLVGMSDGSVLRLLLPQQMKFDLELVCVNKAL